MKTEHCPKDCEHLKYFKSDTGRYWRCNNEVRLCCLCGNPVKHRDCIKSNQCNTIPAIPEDLPPRTLRDGCTNYCEICGSGVIRGWNLELKCLNKECKFNIKEK